MVKPVVVSADGKAFEAIGTTSTLDVSAIPVSTSADNIIIKNDDGIALRAEDLVSDSAGNALVVEVDGKLFVAFNANDLVSEEDGNLLRLGNDVKLYISGHDIVSSVAGNNLSVAEDGRVYFAGSGGGGGGTSGVSADPGQRLTLGSDSLPLLLASNVLSTNADNALSVVGTGLYLAPASLVSSNSGNILEVDSSGKLYVTSAGFTTDILSPEAGNSIVTDQQGRLYVAGYTAGNGGITVANNQISARVQSGGGLAVGVTGLYVNPADIISDNTDNLTSLDSSGKAYTAPYTPGDASINITGRNISARLLADGGLVLGTNGLSIDKSVLLSTNEGNAISIDGTGYYVGVRSTDPILSIEDNRIRTTLSLSYNDATGELAVYGRSDTTPAATVTIPTSASVLENAELVTDPAGQPAGTYIVFTFKLGDGETQMLYLNVSDLFVNYTAADDSITIANEAIAVKRKTGGGVGLDADGVFVDTSSIINTGGGDNILEEDNGTLRVRPYVAGDSSIDVTEQQITVRVTEGGGVLIGDEGLYISAADLNLVTNTVQIIAGTGLAGGGTLVQNRTLSADIATPANITAGTAGKLVDASGLLGFLPAFIQAQQLGTEIRVARFNGSGSYQLQTNARGPVLFWLTGGGGSGAAVTGTLTAGGGAAGMSVFGVSTQMVAGNTYPVVIGAGGTPVTAPDTAGYMVGVNGGTSTFIGYNCSGGHGGQAQLSSFSICGGGSLPQSLTGTGISTIILEVPGGAGGRGLRDQASTGRTYGGDGGYSMLGRGGTGTRYEVEENALNGGVPIAEIQRNMNGVYGGGGGGRGSMPASLTSLTSGAGGAGVCMVWSFIRV